MPFDLRCPLCQAKLRLAEAPAPRSAVECPKCGESFAAPARPAAPKDEPKKDEPKKPKPTEDTKAATGEKVVSKNRVHMNEYAMLGIVGGSVAVFGLLLAVFLWWLNRAARVEDLLAMLPKNAHAVRGVNYGQLKKYPGYKSILDKHYTGPVKAAFEELDKAAGTGGADTALNYVLLAREMPDTGGDGLSMLFNLKVKVDAAGLAAAIKADTLTQGSETYYRLPASSNPLTSYAILYSPTPTNLLVIPEPNAAGARPKQKPSAAALARLDQAIGYKSEKPETRFPGDIGTAGKLAVRGHSWEVIRSTGGTKSTAQMFSQYARKGLPGNDTKPAPPDPTVKAGACGWWVTVGGRGVRLGYATELDSSEEASGVVKKYQEGPLGKGDESEVPNGMKSALPVSGQKEFLEFLQNLSFRSKGPAAYITSKMETGPDKARPLVDLFTKSIAATPFLGGGGGGPPGLPGG